MLLDFQMPMKTGVQVILEIRKFIKDKNLKEPKFVILSSFATP